jgi:hypothetical protein
LKYLASKDLSTSSAKVQGALVTSADFLEPAMDSAEVVMGDMDRNLGHKAIKLLGEAQRQPCKLTHKGADRQIIAIDMRGAY